MCVCVLCVFRPPVDIIWHWEKKFVGSFWVDDLFLFSCVFYMHLGTHGCPMAEITPGLFTCHFKDISSPESIPNLGKNIGLVVNSACPHFQVYIYIYIYKYETITSACTINNYLVFCIQLYTSSAGMNEKSMKNDTFPGYCNTYPGFYGPDVEVCNIDLLDDPKVCRL